MLRKIVNLLQERYSSFNRKKTKVAQKPLYSKYLKESPSTWVWDQKVVLEIAEGVLFCWEKANNIPLG